MILIPSGLKLETEKTNINFYPDGTIDKQRIYVCKNENCYTVSSREQESIVRLFSQRVE